MQVECTGCYGTGVDDSGEPPILCPCCNGTASLDWDRVRFLGMESRYDAATRLAAGAEYVRHATEAIR